MKDDRLETHLQHLFSDAVLSAVSTETHFTPPKRRIRPKRVVMIFSVLLMSVVLVAALSRLGRKNQRGNNVTQVETRTDTGTTADFAASALALGQKQPRLTVVTKHAALLASPTSSLASSTARRLASGEAVAQIEQPTTTPTSATMVAPTETATPASAVTPTPTPAGHSPAPPSSLQVTPIDVSHVRLDWSDNSDNESGFGICDGNACIATTGANTTSYTLGDLVPDSYHCFRIFAFNDFGNSPWTDWACVSMPLSAATPADTPTPTSDATPTSTPPSQPPAQPSNLQITPIDFSRVRLDWSDNSDNESGFGICEGNACTAATEADATTYTVGDLMPDSYHCFRVFAFNDAGSSPSTGWTCVSTPHPTAAPNE